MEFKYKAKDIITKQWVYGTYFKHQKVTHCPIGENIYTDDDYQHLIIRSGFSDWELLRRIEVIEIDKTTLSISVGNKDENGKETFTGDIIVGEICGGIFAGNTRDKKCFVVMWDDFNKCVAVQCHYQNGYTANYRAPISNMIHYKIAGNIYDNPELLDNLKE